MLLLTIFLLLGLSSAATPPSICFVIRSQPNSYFIRQAEALKSNIEAQVEESHADVKVIMIHEEYASKFDSAWTILPIIPNLARTYGASKDWIMFVETGTIIDLKNLLKTLSQYNPKEDFFLARGLFDNEVSIIHHFSQRKAKSGGPFLFPDFETGWALSQSFLRKVGKKYSKETPKVDFQIDVKHEIAVYFSDTFGVEITQVADFCGGGEETPQCATKVTKDLPVCDESVTLDDVFVGVKTTLMFHKDRVKVVMNTWGPHVKHMILYSNITDPSIPTVDCGVENTVRGHCGKTDAMLKNFYEISKSNDYKWYVIVDDDTIMSVARLLQFLSCFDPNEAMFLGEKYGYGLTTDYGYAYITGGGGMVFSKPAVETWVKKCRCPANDSPDDMILGNLLSRYGVPVIHSPLFHQARPQEYAEGYLGNQIPISFHKHFMVDPVKIYEQWFEEADSKLPIFTHVKDHVTTTPTPIAIPTPLPPTPLENPIKDEL